MAASVAPVDVGGYDCALFVSSVPEELKCGLCKKVAREPNLTSCCGEHFCKLCIEQNIRNKRPCPSCDTSQFSFINDKRDHKKILALKVRCVMKDRGCNWTDTLEQLDAHLDANSDTGCQYVDVNCPNECEQPVQKLQLPTHLAKQCTKRDFFCQYCNFKATYEVVCNDHWPQCPFYPIPCPNGCEIMALERGDLDAHLMVCSLEEVECEFNHAGCKVKLVREEMKIHLADNLQRHVMMMNKAGQEKMEQKERKIKQLEARLEEKDRQVQEAQDQQIQKIREEKKKEIQKLRVEKDRQIQGLRGERDQQLEELRRQIQEERNREIQTLREEKERQIGEMKRTRSHILCASAVCLLCILLYLRLKHEGLIKSEQERVQEAHTRHLVDDLQRHILMMNKAVQEKMEQKERKIEELEARLEEKDRQVQEHREEKDRQVQELEEKTQATHAEVARVEEQLKVHVQEYEGRFGVAQFTMTGFHRLKRGLDNWISPPVYTHPGGYRIGISVWPNGHDEGTGTHVSVYLRRAKGENDDHLKWPADCTITLQLLNQHRDRDHFTVSKRLQWDKPTTTQAGLTFAKPFDYRFVAHKVLDWNADRQTQYLKNDCLQFRMYRIQVHSV